MYWGGGKILSPQSIDKEFLKKSDARKVQESTESFYLPSYEKCILTHGETNTGKLRCTWRMPKIYQEDGTYEIIVFYNNKFFDKVNIEYTNKKVKALGTISSPYVAIEVCDNTEINGWGSIYMYDISCNPNLTGFACIRGFYAPYQHALDVDIFYKKIG